MGRGRDLRCELQGTGAAGSEGMPTPEREKVRRHL